MMNKIIRLLLFFSASYLHAEVKTNVSPEEYTIRTVEFVPWILELVDNDECYWPIRLTDGTVFNTGGGVGGGKESQTGGVDFVPGSQLQQLRFQWGSCGIALMKNGKRVEVNKYGNPIGISMGYFISVSGMPDHQIARVEKVTQFKDDKTLIYPLITLADGSVWLLAKTQDDGQSIWKVGDLVLILKNITDPIEYSYAFVKPHIHGNWSYPYDVYNQKCTESFIESFTIPDVEYMIEDWM